MCSDRAAQSLGMVNAELRNLPNQLVEAPCSPSVNHFHLRIGNRCFNASCVAEVEKGCPMGVSNRATHTIVPGNGDLLMPDRGRKPRTTRVRDVEDARFEAVGRPRDVFSTRSRAAASSTDFRSRIVHIDDTGPVPRDFAASDYGLRKTSSRTERLGVFGGAAATHKARRFGSPLSRSGLTLAGFAVAAAAVWMAGGHALVTQPESIQPASAATTPAAAVTVTDRAMLRADPVVTSSIPARPAKGDQESFTAPVPRPARIERAGSILMIRPAGN